ncbi:uncharacterized protein LOC133922134 [Phragmites australis]|uniref:uncharacterized protein LOC133922134 n=1 Tax=Phragmites australis TaxID=29695 RepID=UPI002D77C472|nr:uncharacterized protein LOC133922134 [Phragmites australis]XP_062223312.1 uncharacterized protein LOC133922134 [Phragmites australis]XP_062223313.1 uncharacterized protein LOC133922134 [Phragmites australis]
MKLQHESSDAEALVSAASRNLSASSSAFVSANQSPFFTPRSLSARVPEHADLENKCSSNGIVLKVSDILSSDSLIQQKQRSSANVGLLPSDASPISLCTSSNFGTPAIVYNNPKFISTFNGPCQGSSSATSNGGCSARKEKQRRLGGIYRKSSSSQPTTSAASVSRLRSYDVYIGFHGRKASLLRFTNWLRAELEIHGISCFASDRSRCQNSHSHDAIERIMNASTYGVVVLTKKSFGNPYTIEELRNFFGKKNLIPVFFDLGAADCLARDIIEKRGELWEKHGGELWMLYGGIKHEWTESIDALSRVVDVQLEANDGNWRDCILQAVILLATKLGRRSVVDRVNRWRGRMEKEEFPFPRNDDFVGRKKELSELELILFGDVTGDGEREFFELKTKQRRKGRVVRRSANNCEQINSDDSKGKEPILWKETEKDIEMQRLGSPPQHGRPLRVKNGVRYGRKKRSRKILYGKGIACISGEPGIGKTDLVLEYAYRFFQRYKMVLWIRGEGRYIRQNYLALRTFLEVDLSVDSHLHEKGSDRCFEEQEEEAIAKIRQELMRDIPFLVIIDNLESEKDWWDKRVIMDLLPHFSGETHFIITTRLPRVMNLEPMKLSYLSGAEAMALMKGGVKDYPLVEIDALKIIEEKLGRLTLGLSIVGAILSELPITPTRLLDTLNRTPPIRDLSWNEREVLSLKNHEVLVRLLDVCLSIFDHADGPRSLATRMVQVCGWFAPSAVPVHMLALAAHKVPKKHRRGPRWRKWWRTLTCGLATSRMKRSEAEAAAMLMRFGIARCSAKAEHVQFHDLIKLYARKQGGTRTALAVVQSVYLQGSIKHTSEHLWASCFIVFGFGSDPLLVELRPSELMFFVKQIVMPLAIHTFITYSRCNAALELLRLCTDALERAAESMLAHAGKWRETSFSCFRSAESEAQYTYLWQELALLKASVLETRVKLMLRGGQYDIGDDLIRKAIFIRTSICGEHHPDTVSARETLSKLTRLLTTVQLS